jgi:hypothetical protein
MIRITQTLLLIAAIAIAAIAQSESAYGDGGSATSPSADGPSTSASFLDPSRFSVNHAVSFMAGGSQVSNLQSQSVYSTMMQYKFNAPVVLSLNFDMPIHSTFNQYNNFTSDNLSSLEYFKNMPIDASVTWMPTDKFMLRMSVIKQPESGYFYNGFYRPDRFYRGW